VFIDAGYGTGVVSAGKTMNRKWRLVWFAGKSPDPGCLNMRAFMAARRRDWLKGRHDREGIRCCTTISPRSRPFARLDGKIQLEARRT